MVGGAILTACHVLNRVPTKNKEITPFEEWEKKMLKLSYLRTWGCLAKVNVPIPKKRKLGPKTVDCVFLGYAFHSIGYRFLIVNLRYLTCMLVQSWSQMMRLSLKTSFP